MSIEVEIFGQKYALRADADEEHVRKVADLVDQKMREVATGSRSISTMQIAVLAALDIASEYVQQRSRLGQLTADVESRSDRLAQRIEDVVHGF